MGRNYRPERLGEEIRRLISHLMLRELQDPRFSGIVSISKVDVTTDYSYATVYIMVLGDSSKDEADEGHKTEVLEAFQSAKGMIRREIGKKIKMRHVPDLLFKIDTSMEYGRHISQVIAELGLDRKEGAEDTEVAEDEEL